MAGNTDSTRHMKQLQDGLELLDATVQVGGTIFGQLEEERLRARNAAYEAQRYRNSAVVARYEAEYARTMAALNAKEIVRSFRRRQGNARLSMAASGVVMTEGSPVDALMDRAGEAAKAQEMALYQGEMSAWRKENMAWQAQMKSVQAQESGRPTFASRFQAYQALRKGGNRMYSAFDDLLNDLKDKPEK